MKLKSRVEYVLTRDEANALVTKALTDALAAEGVDMAGRVVAWRAEACGDTTITGSNNWPGDDDFYFEYGALEGKEDCIFAMLVDAPKPRKTARKTARKR